MFTATTPFSAALCRGLIEACPSNGRSATRPCRFPAALCRGLIEAAYWRSNRPSLAVFSAALCRGLIEAIAPTCRALRSGSVFRGFMPRPH